MKIFAFDPSKPFNRGEVLDNIKFVGTSKGQKLGGGDVVHDAIIAYKNGDEVAINAETYNVRAIMCSMCEIYTYDGYQEVWHNMYCGDFDYIKRHTK